MRHDQDFYPLCEGERLLRERRKAEATAPMAVSIRTLALITLFIMAVGYLQIHDEYHAVAAWLHHHPMLILSIGVAFIFRKRFFRLAKRAMK